MQFLMPFLIEVPLGLWNLMLMHNVKDVISDTLPGARTFTYHRKHLPEQV